MSPLQLLGGRERTRHGVRGLAAATVAGAQIAGGVTAELYDPRANRWTATGSMPFGRVDGQTTMLLPDGTVLVVGGGGDAATPAALFDPKAGSWSNATPGITSLGGQTATLLASGRVLLAGGWDGNESIAAVFLYDPTQGVWSSPGPLKEARVSAQAALLPDGRVLVVAGSTDAVGLQPLAIAELFDPAAP